MFDIGAPAISILSDLNLEWNYYFNSLQIGDNRSPMPVPHQFFMSMSFTFYLLPLTIYSGLKSQRFHFFYLLKQHTHYSMQEKIHKYLPFKDSSSAAYFEFAHGLKFPDICLRIYL